MKRTPEAARLPEFFSVIGESLSRIFLRFGSKKHIHEKFFPVLHIVGIVCCSLG